MQKQYNIAGYVRLSVEDEHEAGKFESNSITNQKELIQEFVENMEKETHNISFVGFFEDDGYSGTNFDRPGFIKLQEAIENGLVNTVIFKDISRLGRNEYKVFQFLREYCPLKGIRVISITNGFDSEKNTSNTDVMSFEVVISSMYSADISKKVKTAVHTRKKQGMFLGSLAPYGYVKDSKNKNHLVINEERAAVVRRIFDMFVSGVKKSEIASILSQEKIYCPGYYDHGGAVGCEYKWSSDTIKRILENKIYIGIIQYGKRNTPIIGGKQKVVKKEDWQEVKGNHEPIITEEVFNKAQKLLEIKKSTRQRKTEWELKGLVKCGICGKTMQVCSINGKIKLLCPNGSSGKCEARYKKIETSIVEKALKKEEKKELRNITKKAKLIKKAQESNVLKNKNIFLNNQIQSLENRQEKINVKISRIYDDMLEGLIQKEDYERIYNSCLNEREDIKEKIGQCKDELSKTKEVDVEVLEQIVKDFMNLKQWGLSMYMSLVRSVEVLQDKSVRVNFIYDLKE